MAGRVLFFLSFARRHAMSRPKVPKLLSLIYVHNPFYLISTCLFVYGLKLLFRSGDTSVLFAPGSVSYMEP